LHVEHEANAIADAGRAFTRLIDHAISYEGSYYLTYHRFARPDQVLTCYPRFRQWLASKDQVDPQRTFQSDWYRHLLRFAGDEAR
jgi:hypothetical protein